VPAAATTVSHAAGIALVVMAALLLVPAPALFLRNRTTIIPHADARRLVTSGPYRLTRNPMYLALTIAYVGVALAMNLLWPLPFLILPLWVLDRKIIPFEEANLARIFGAEYRAYRARVRRWI
jgi:protein-S-isoprenylcysteine O-methyltransferase Ste14